MASVVKRIGVGTNLGLVKLMWAMMQGSFLMSRGSIHEALRYSGFDKEEIQGTWSSFCKGQWSIHKLLTSWRAHVKEQKVWQGHEREGYKAVAADITSYVRPALQGWLGKIYQGYLNRSVNAIGFGIVAEIGSIEKQRLALPKKLLRAKNQEASEKELKLRLIAWLAKHLFAHELAILDAGFKLSELQAAHLERYIVRLASNCTARRNELPSYKGRGAKPRYGDLIRPLARKYKGNSLAASKPDETTDFDLEGRKIQVHRWHDLVRADQKPAQDNQHFNLMVFFDPLYQQPLVLAVSLDLAAQSVFLFYRDRWPIEQIPLAAKQMLGCKRAFVSNPEALFRLPELALLVGNMLSYLAATLPAIPSGFWDKQPKKRLAAYAGL